MSDPIASPSDLATLLQQDVDTATATLLLSLAQGLAEDIVTPLPASAKAVVLSAAARAFANPQNLSNETVGPYTATHAGAGVFLTKAEERALKRAAGRGGAFSVDPTPADAGQQIAIENAEQWLITYPDGVFDGAADRGIDDALDAPGQTFGGVLGFDDWPFS